MEGEKNGAVVVLAIIPDQVTPEMIERAHQLADMDLKAMREIAAAGPAAFPSLEAFMDEVTVRYQCAMISFENVTLLMLRFADLALRRAQGAVETGQRLQEAAAAKADGTNG